MTMSMTPSLSLNLLPSLLFLLSSPFLLLLLKHLLSILLRRFRLVNYADQFMRRSARSLNARLVLLLRCWGRNHATFREEPPPASQSKLYATLFSCSMRDWSLLRKWMSKPTSHLPNTISSAMDFCWHVFEADFVDILGQQLLVLTTTKRGWRMRRKGKLNDIMFNQIGN